MCSFTYLSQYHVKKTRKKHRCCWCGETIDKASKAWVNNYTDAGDFHSDYWHVECDQGSRAFFAENDDCFMPGEFYRGLPISRDENLSRYVERFGSDASNPWYQHNLEKAGVIK